MKLAVWYHCRLSGGRDYLDYSKPMTTRIDPTYARQMFKDQIGSVVSSGLYENSNQIFIGVNGAGADAEFVRKNMPDGCEVIEHGEKAESLVPTMKHLQDWLPDHEDWLCCFFHQKGVTHPYDPLCMAWRACMDRNVIWRWARCVDDLKNGYEVVGCHWLTAEKFPQTGPIPFMGGVYWWATAKFLMLLPKMQSEVHKREDWYRPELFIGSGPRRPKVRDYHPAWPGVPGCSKALMT